jgi:hypothetical protein
MTRMGARHGRLRGLGIVVVVLTSTCLVASAVLVTLTGAGEGLESFRSEMFAQDTMVVALGGPGAWLLLGLPRHPAGWLMTSVAAALTLNSLGGAWSLFAATGGRELPLADVGLVMVRLASLSGSGSAAPAPALPGRPTALEPLAPRPAGNRRRRSAARPGQPFRPAQLRVRRRGARRGAPCLPRDTGPHRADRSARRLVARGRRWRHPPRRRPAAAGAAEPRRPLPSRGRHRDGTAAMVGGRRPGHAGRGRRLEADAVGGRQARLGRGHPRAGRDGDGRGASLSPRRRGADPQPNRRVRRADRARHRSVRRGGRDGDGTLRRTSRTLGRRSRGGHRLRTAAHPAADLDGSQAARRAN